MQDDPLEDGQNPCWPAVSGFPHKMLIIPTVVTREGLVGPRHNRFGVSQERVLQEIRENLGQ